MRLTSLTSYAAEFFAARPLPHRSRFLHWLVGIGPFGLFVVSVIDSSVIPLPGGADILLILLTITNGNWIVLAACAWAGSMIGGYLTYRLGVKGGQAVLQHHVPAKRLASIERHVRHNSFLAILVPSLLPPPIPLVPFVLTAGALCMPPRIFLTAYGVGRGLRYGLIGWLGALYGRHLLRKWGEFSRNWSVPITWAMIGIVIAAVAFAVWQYRRQSRKVHQQKTGETAKSEQPQQGDVPVA